MGGCGVCEVTQDSPVGERANCACGTQHPRKTVDRPAAEGALYRLSLRGTGHDRHIKAEDLPAPYATESATSGPKLVARPADAWPKAPQGFKVEQYATGLNNPRIIRTAPNGDFFLAETNGGDIKVFRGITKDGKPAQMQVFATGLNTPFGIAFYPPGPDPQWIYVGNTNAVVRFPYQNGDMTATGPAAASCSICPRSGHYTRDIQFSPDGKTMFVSVGSGSNVNDPGHTSRRKKSRRHSGVQS